MVAGAILFLAKCFECCGEGMWKRPNGGYSGRCFRVNCKCSVYRSAFRIPCLVWICRGKNCLKYLFQAEFRYLDIMTFAYIMCFVHTLYLLNQLIWRRSKVHALVNSLDECLNLAVSKVICEWVKCANHHWTGSAVLWSIEEYPFSIQRCSFGGIDMCRRDNLAVFCWLSS